MKLLDEAVYSFVVDAYIYFSGSGKLIMLCLADSIKVIVRNSLQIMCDVYAGSQPIQAVLSPDERYLIAGLSSGELLFYDVENEDELKIRVHDSSIQSLFASRDQTVVHTFSSDSTLARTRFPRLSMYKNTIDISFPFNAVLINSKSYENMECSALRAECSKEKEETFKPLCMAQSEAKDLIIVGGESFNISVWDRISMVKYGDLMGHFGHVYSLACLSDEIVASGSTDCKIILWNYRKMRKMHVLTGHTDTVSAVVKIDKARVASGSWDRTIRVWIWGVQNLIYCIHGLPDRVMALCTPKHNKLMIGMKNLIHCWDLHSYCLMFEKRCKKEITCFRIFENAFEGHPRVYIGLSMEEDSLWIEDPFLSTHAEFWGKTETGSYEFIRYIRDIMRYQIPVYDSEMDKFTIFPNQLNILHFYAYFNIPEYLGLSIRNSTPMLVSSCLATPLTIAISQRNIDCIEAIIKAAWEIRHECPYFLSVITIEDLQSINLVNTTMASKLYKLLLIDSVYRTKAYAAELSLPCINCSEISTSYVKNWIDEKEREGIKATEIEFSQSLIPFYMEPGTRKSIDFLNSLKMCAQQQVHKTGLVKNYVKWKWDLIKGIIAIEICLYVIYFSLLCMFAVGIITGMKFIGIYLIGVVLGVVNLWYYIKISSRLKYQSAMQLIFLNFYLILTFLGYYNTIILIILLSDCALQGVKYLNLFQKMSATIRLFIEIFVISSKILILFLYLFLPLMILPKKTSLDNLFLGLHVAQYLSTEDSETTEVVSSLENLSNSLNLTYLLAILIFYGMYLILIRDLNKSIDTEINSSKLSIDFILKAESLLIWKRLFTNREYIQICAKISRKTKTKLQNLKFSILEVKKQQDIKGIEILKHRSEISSLLNAISSTLSQMQTSKSRINTKAIR